jgi:hypothetical protein
MAVEETVAVSDLARFKAMHERQKLQVTLLTQLRYFDNLHKRFVPEYRFDVNRQWRLDLYSVQDRLGVELHGGIWRLSRHTTGAGFTRDREKMNACVEAGIRVLEYTTEHVRSGTAALQIQRILTKETPP